MRTLLCTTNTHHQRNHQFPSKHELMTKLLLQVREDIMEQSMVYEGYVKSEGIYEGEGRLLFKNGTFHTMPCNKFAMSKPVKSCHIL